MPKLPPHPRYRHHRPSQQAVVTIDGREIYLGRHGTAASWEKYDRLILEWLANDRSLPKPQEAITIVELGAAYFRHCKTYYTKNGKPTDTVAAAKRTIQLVTSFYGRLPAKEFGPQAMKALTHRMIDLDWSRKFVNDNIATIKRMIRWGVVEELIPPEIFQRVDAVPGLRKGRTLARETPPVRPISDAIVEITLTKLGVVVAAMVQLQRLTGSRPGEICNLRPMDVDTSSTVWLYRPSEHKTEHHDQQRVIPIGPKGQDILRPFLLRPADLFCFSPQDSEKKRRREMHDNRSVPMSCGNRPGTNLKASPRRYAGDRYDNNSYRRAIHRACDLAFPTPDNLDGEARAIWQSEHRWSPNRLRHTAATEIRDVFGLESAQCVLGHKQASITEIYAERDLTKAVEVARQIG